MKEKTLIEGVTPTDTQTNLGVRNLHMVSGEDYVGQVWYDPESEQYFVERPIIINVSFDPGTGKFSISPLPLRPYLKKFDQLALENKDVMWILPVTEQMEELWRRFTSDIVVPSGGIIDPSSLRN